MQKQSCDPNVGTWKLNVTKSKYNPGPPPKSGMLRITAQDNSIRVVLDGVDAKGQATHTEFAAKYDGNDYPYTGNPIIDTVAFTRIDPNTYDSVNKKNGKQVQSGRVVISKDGKTRTLTTKGKDDKGQDTSSTSVFNKQ